MTLRELLDWAAAELGGVESTTTRDGGASWSRGGRPFAAVSGDSQAAEFALDPAVAVAAIRTPDVGPSSRGAGWVRFQPATLDDHGRDRAKAWFESAHRRLGA